MKLWLDDVRQEPRGWLRAYSVDEAIAFMISEPVTHVSLDHDLGAFEPFGGDGPKFTDWMAEYERWPTEGLRIHSSNPSGVRTMLATVDRYSPFALGGGTARGEAPEGGWPPIDGH